MLNGEPKPDEVLPEFYKFIGGSILVAHNAAFDIGFLRNEFAFKQMQMHRALDDAKLAAGSTKYINQRDEDFILAYFQEDNYRKEFTNALQISKPKSNPSLTR